MTLALAAAIVVVIAAALAVPQSRDAVADLLGIDGLRLRFDEPKLPGSPTSLAPNTAAGAGAPAVGSVPASVAASSGSANSSPASLGSGTSGPGGAGSPVGGPPGSFDPEAVAASLNLGRRIDAAEARTVLVQLHILDGASIGAPDAIYQGRQPIGLITMVWRTSGALPDIGVAPGVGLVLQQYASAIDPGYLQKVVGGSARLALTTVGGERAYWIEGVHSLQYVVDATAASPAPDSVRWTTNALVWAKGGVTYRLESNLTRSQAEALAAQLA